MKRQALKIALLVVGFSLITTSLDYGAGVELTWYWGFPLGVGAALVYLGFVVGFGE
jgi:hypothetical protein